jgi:hypothetical protein
LGFCDSALLVSACVYRDENIKIQFRYNNPDNLSGIILPVGPSPTLFGLLIQIIKHRKIVLFGLYEMIFRNYPDPYITHKI